MMYSCALWSDEEGGPAGDMTMRSGAHGLELEAAQLRKIHHVLLRHVHVRLLLFSFRVLI